MCRDDVAMKANLLEDSFPYPIFQNTGTIQFRLFLCFVEGFCRIHSDTTRETKLRVTVGHASIFVFFFFFTVACKWSRKQIRDENEDREGRPGNDSDSLLYQ